MLKRFPLAVALAAALALAGCNPAGLIVNAALPRVEQARAILFDQANGNLEIACGTVEVAHGFYQIINLTKYKFSAATTAKEAAIVGQVRGWCKNPPKDVWDLLAKAWVSVQDLSHIPGT